MKRMWSEEEIESLLTKVHKVTFIWDTSTEDEISKWTCTALMLSPKKYLTQEEALNILSNNYVVEISILYEEGEDGADAQVNYKPFVIENASNTNIAFTGIYIDDSLNSGANAIDKEGELISYIDELQEA